MLDAFTLGSIGMSICIAFGDELAVLRIAMRHLRRYFCLAHLTLLSSLGRLRLEMRPSRFAFRCCHAMCMLLSLPERVPVHGPHGAQGIYGASLVATPRIFIEVTPHCVLQLCLSHPFGA